MIFFFNKVLAFPVLFFGMSLFCNIQSQNLYIQVKPLWWCHTDTLTLRFFGRGHRSPKLILTHLSLSLSFFLLHPQFDKIVYYNAKDDVSTSPMHFSGLSVSLPLCRSVDALMLSG